jgi:hypothetical protein
MDTAAWRCVWWHNERYILCPKPHTMNRCLAPHADCTTHGGRTIVPTTAATPIRRTAATSSTTHQVQHSEAHLRALQALPHAGVAAALFPSPQCTHSSKKPKRHTWSYFACRLGRWIPFWWHVELPLTGPSTAASLSDRIMPVLPAICCTQFGRFSD